MTNSKASTPQRQKRTPAAKTFAGKAAPANGQLKNSANGASPVSTKASVGADKHKAKVVRDSFTIPKPEYVVIDALKLRAAKLGRPTKKSEVLRAGIKVLAALSDKAFLAAIDQVPNLKTGRPPKSTDTKLTDTKSAS